MILDPTAGEDLAMDEERALTVLCMSSYEKGQEFMRACKEQGCRVFLVTVEKLREANWPREAIEEIFYMPEEMPLQAMIYAVSYMARTRPIDRIVALDEFDMENAAALREHLRVPGMGLTTVRYFRDKLAMRARAKEGRILVPDFVHVLNYDAIREYMERVEPPWLLKPRSQASGIGMKKIERADDLWPWLEKLGDQQSFYLLEQFIPGDIFHVDSIVSERKVVFAEAHAYGRPPFEVAHYGGVFTTRTLPRTSVDGKALLKINRELIEALGLARGVTHAEFLRAHSDGRFYFVEIAARVGGAYIANMVEAATGINLWREWARVEIGGGKSHYDLPKAQREHAGVILSLARQEHPDTSAYTEPEIVERVTKFHHVGFILKSHKADRVHELLDSFAARFQTDFTATQPIPDKPTA
jgi:biotin carboxylase